MRDVSRIGFILALCAITPQFGNAQQAKPEHVFQVTQTAVEELRALNGENFTSAATAAAPNAPAMPRHVLFLARDQWRKLQLLRFMNGLETLPLGDVGVRQVTPGEVKELVDRLLAKTRELRPAYGLGESEISVSLVSGKKPTDVYGSLKQISTELSALGVPATVPNDVYRVALTVSQSLNVVAKTRSLEVDVSSLKKEAGKTPADVYLATLDLLKDLADLTTQTTDFSIPGDVQIPTKKTDAVTPDDVIEVLSRALADIMAVMYVTNTASDLSYAPYSGGKTPADVYREIRYAQLIIAALKGSTT